MKSDRRGVPARRVFLAAAAFVAALFGEARADDLFDHSDFDAILRARVDSGGLVDYEGLLADRAALDAYVARMGDVERASLDSRRREERMAFWINAYNAITLARILDHWPPKGLGLIHPKLSIRNIDGVWDKLTTRVAGAEITLDAIEHEILRPEFGDPRIHAAIVCASIGCPALRNRAYTAENLDAQLDRAARDFVRDPSKNLVDRDAKVVELSPIFKWFAEDFAAQASEVPSAAEGKLAKYAGGLGFLARHASEEDAEFLRSGDYKAKYGDYDWSLNAQ